MANETETKEVECRTCHRQFVPSFEFDYYGADENGKNGQCERCMMREAFGGEKPEPVALPSGEHINLVCRRKTGSGPCRFLSSGAKGMVCAKGSTLEATIQQQVEHMRSRGDNCSGPPDFIVIVE